MTDLELWSAVVGFFSPLLIAVVNQSRWPAPLKGLVAFLMCLLIAAGYLWLEGALSRGTWIHSALFVVFSAIGSYKLLWQPSRIAPAIEAATSAR